MGHRAMTLLRLIDLRRAGRGIVFRATVSDATRGKGLVWAKKVCTILQNETFVSYNSLLFVVFYNLFKNIPPGFPFFLKQPQIFT